MKRYEMEFVIPVRVRVVAEAMTAEAARKRGKRAAKSALGQMRRSPNAILCDMKVRQLCDMKVRQVDFKALPVTSYRSRQMGARR